MGFGCYLRPGSILSKMGERKLSDRIPMDLEGSFYEYLHEMGYAGEAWNQEVLRFYVPYFKPPMRVLDVGCGQGQFMELLTAVGVAVEGVDIDRQMVQVCLRKGLSVVESDLFAYLAGCPEQFDGIFSSNVIEHLSTSDVIRFVKLAYSALRPGGILLLATPNPKSLIVHLYEFWRDATHVRFYSEELLEFLLHTSGFLDIESGANPQTIWQPDVNFTQLPALWTGPESMSSNPLPWEACLQGELSTVSHSWKTRLRRRLAHFLTRTIMFEEFTSLAEGFQYLDKRYAELRRTTFEAIRVLYHTQRELVVVPREVYVLGRKPEVG